MKKTLLCLGLMLVVGSNVHAHGGGAVAGGVLGGLSLGGIIGAAASHHHRDDYYPTRIVYVDQNTGQAVGQEIV